MCRGKYTVLCVLNDSGHYKTSDDTCDHIQVGIKNIMGDNVMLFLLLLFATTRSVFKSIK